MHIRENDDAALLEPHIGAFLCVAERAVLIRTLCSKKSPGAIFHDRLNLPGANLNAHSAARRANYRT